MDRGELKDVLTEIFEERSRIDSESHAKHHEWIEIQIERDKKRMQFYDRIGSAVVQWSVLGLLSAIATRLWSGHWPTVG